MDRHELAASQILEAVKVHPECALGELILSLPGLGWAEIVHGVIRLSRSGQLRLSQSSLGLTTKLHAL
jgi:hypothetical protein